MNDTSNSPLSPSARATADPAVKTPADHPIDPNTPRRLVRVDSSSSVLATAKRLVCREDLESRIVEGAKNENALPLIAHNARRMDRILCDDG
mmetsp:Transcript_42878/g.86696  ORF Transcript_42878/g.86696 Transcript_42878/m.86696 type:complete len:92 (+) Transcript_42878:803-1078(+)